MATTKRAAADPDTGLTPPREEFAKHVASGKPLAEAYRLAYPGSRAWLDKTVWSRACELAADGKVAGRVRALRALVSERFVLDETRLLLEAYRLATFDARNLFDGEGKLRAPKDWPADVAAAIAGYDVDADGKVKVRLWDKNSALEKLFKNRGLFANDNQQRYGALAELPRELLRRIEEHLSGLVGSELAGQPAEPSAARTTH